MNLFPDIEDLGLQPKIKKLEGVNEADVRDKIVNFSTGEENGQFRVDCKWRYHDIVGIRLGHPGPRRASEIDKRGALVRQVSEIYIDKTEKNRTYTLFLRTYPAFLHDALATHLSEPCWFLPSIELNRPVVYEGKLEAILMLIEHCWMMLYEFTLSALDLSWLADYNHHHSIQIYGDKESGRARNLCEKRRRWQDMTLECNWYGKSVK